MGYIVDISKHQPSSRINWSVFAKNIDLLILRVQYGSNTIDKEYANHVANAKKYKLPFMTYAFPQFVSVDDARVEARDHRKRTDKDSLADIIDIETEYDSKTKKPKGLTKLTKSVRLAAIKAYVDELRKDGSKRVGAYIGHNVYESWGINTILEIFDFIWIPKYSSNKPSYPCDLWQYSSTARINGYNSDLDVSKLNGKKDLNWFLGKEVKKQNVNESIKKLEEKVMGLTDAQGKMVQRLKDLKLTDGLNPQNAVNNLYLWSMINQTIDLVYTDMNKIKQELRQDIAEIKAKLNK